MDILCTDKPGTLTQDKIVLDNRTDISGKTSERVLGSAVVEQSLSDRTKNLLDTAVLEDRMKSQRARWPVVGEKIDEIPFDSSVVGCGW